MIGGSEIARRYARALFALGEDAPARARLFAELDTLAEEISANSELERALFTPIYPRTERKALIRELSERLAISPEVRTFSALLVDQNRTALLIDIRDELRALVDAEAGRMEAHIVSARPLAPDVQQQIQQAISRRVNANVTLAVAIDPTLIGGIVARIGDLLLDGSIRTQLENLGANLRKGPAT